MINTEYGLIRILVVDIYMINTEYGLIRLLVVDISIINTEYGLIRSCISGLKTEYGPISIVGGYRSAIGSLLLYTVLD